MASSSEIYNYKVVSILVNKLIKQAYIAYILHLIKLTSGGIGLSQIINNYKPFLKEYLFRSLCACIE